MHKTQAVIGAQDLEQLSGLFRLLSDKTRLGILLCLTDGERNVSSLCEQLGLPQPTVSHHLGLLRLNNIVGNRRHGKQVFYVLNRGGESFDGMLMQFSVQNLLLQVRAKEQGQ